MSASDVPTSSRPAGAGRAPGADHRRGEGAAELALLAVVHALGGHRGPVVAAVRARLGPADQDLVHEVLSEVAADPVAP